MEIYNNYSSEELFLEKANQYINKFKNSEIVLWGKGRQISLLLKYCNELNIKYIVDKNTALSGKTKICDKEFDIYPPQKLIQDKNTGIKIIVMLAGSDYEDISKELLNIGFNESLE